MNASSRFLTLVAVGGALTLAACGGSDVSPVASSAALTTDGGSVTSSGNGPGGPPSPGAFTGHRHVHERLRRHGPGPRTGRGQRLRLAGQRRGRAPATAPGRATASAATPARARWGPIPEDIGDAARRGPPGGVQGPDAVPQRSRDFGPETVPFALIARGRGPARRGAADALHAAADGASGQRLGARRASRPSPRCPSPARRGVVAEREDAAFYTPYLSRTDLPQDVRNVFTNLQAASLENHLPAFERCRSDAMTRTPPRPRARGSPSPAARSSPARDGLSSCP